MSSNPAAIDSREVLTKALLEIRSLRARVAAAEGAANEPIAIVGVGCRFPAGVSDAESFWSALRDGVDGVDLVPRERWDIDALFDADPDAPSKSYSRHGGFVDGIDRFDPALFGISPLEASSMDPQQRLLLEVAWEALENAAIAPDRLRDSRTGVFVGLMYQDYLTRQLNDSGRGGIGAYFGTGSTSSAAAGRLSYVFGLQGPAIVVDTACSSSLVSVHLACQALRNRECEVALAGGVNAMLTPEASINLSKARMLSPTGRCRTFDESADGYVRGEGCGLVILKRLSQAESDGDRILGVIRGSAVNQDGRSNGITAPNGSAQRALLADALRNAGATADDVEYVECHGTGTPLGDPIEIGALLDVYGQRSEASPLALGSVKTNFGHLESAAGICGLIKTLLVLRNREIPPHLHLRKVNKFISFDGRPVAIPTAPTPWFTRDKAMAAVSAFGFVGTNAHVILEAYEEPLRETPKNAQPAFALTVSAADRGALEASRAQLVRHLTQSSGSVEDIAFTANTGRSHLRYRMAVTAADRETLALNLEKASAHEAPIQTPPLLFLFSGQGAHHPRSGAALYETEPLFRSAIDRCAELLREHLDEPLTSLLFGDKGSLLRETLYAQPALVALQYALTELWRSWGVVPTATVGHSVGDYAAAIANGTLTLETALAIVAARGRLMQALPRDGGMAAFFATEEWAAERIAHRGDTLSIAAVNAPSEVVVSGRLDHLRELIAAARAEGLHTRELDVSHAFHSPLMLPMLDAFRRELAGIEGAERWVEHVVAPVRFADAIAAFRGETDPLLLELGPRAVLAPLASRVLPDATALSSLLPGRPERAQMLESLAALYLRGFDVDWSAVHRPFAGRKTALPTYPFQRQRYWIKPAAQPLVEPARAALPVAAAGVLGQAQPSAADRPGTFVWDVDVDQAQRPYRFEHKLLGTAVWPISAHVELAAAAAREALGATQFEISDVEFRQPLYSFTAAEQRVQVVVTMTGDRAADFRLYSQLADGGKWVLNTTARIHELRDTSAVERPKLSMMFFAAKEEDEAQDRYRLIVEAARYADRHGFRSVWVPERHFTHMGSLYPNPSVLHAALARETKQVRLMAGSVVLPLHDVSRVAEEWAMVDNLSGGRVGISFAPGWNPDDFVLAPDRYESRYADLYSGIETMRKLWRGETIAMRGVGGATVNVRTYPTPVQAELPMWLTAARNPETFTRAGSLGANVLTHLLDQDVDALAAKIALYRAARAASGLDPATGVVTVMCHTFVAADLETAHRAAKKPFCEYLKSSMPMLSSLAQSRGVDVDVQKLSGAELDEFVEFLYARFSSTRALIGTPDSCRVLVDALHDAGVDEIACLLDFGPGTATVLEHLPYLQMLNEPAQPVAALPAKLRQRTEFTALEAAAELPPRAFYDGLASTGVEFNGSLQTLVSIRAAEGEAMAEIAAAPADALAIDGCMQTAIAALQPRALTRAHDPVRVPTRIGSVRIHRPLAGGLSAYARATTAVGGSSDGAVSAFDGDGALVMELSGLRIEPIAGATPASDKRFDDWFYEVSWRQEDAQPPSHDRGGAWLILADHSGVAEAWAARRPGARHVFIERAAFTEQVAPGRWTVDVNRGFESILNQVDLGSFEGILCLWPLDASSNERLNVAALEADQQLGLAAVTSLIRTIAGGDHRAVPPLWIATRGAQPVLRTDDVSVSQSTLWGFAAALAREHAEWWGAIVDLDPRVSTQQAAADLDLTLRTASGEDQIAVRAGRRYVRRMARTAAGAPGAVFRNDAAYLIAGGAGGLGLSVARWMVARGARNLIVLGRSANMNITIEGASVSSVALDLADETQLTRFLRERAGPPIRGVIHAAGVYRDDVLLRLTAETLSDVLHAKVSGGWSLDRALAASGAELDFFVFFSSLSALVPPHGQAAYAAASAFMDALAHRRRAAGLPALSINWGAWSEVGFAATAVGAEAHARLEASGMKRMTPDEGLAAFDRLLSVESAAQVAVVPMDLRQLAAIDPTIQRAPLFHDLLGTRSTNRNASLDIRARIAGLDRNAQRHALETDVARVVATVMEMEGDRLNRRTPLTQLGLDSIIAVQLKNRLMRDLGVDVRLVDVLRGATVSSIVDEILVGLQVSALQEQPHALQRGFEQEVEL